MRVFPGLSLALIWTACATGPQKMPASGSPPAGAPVTDRPVETEPARVAFQRGYEAVQKGDLSQAERFFKQALEGEPNLAAAWGNLGIIYERRAMPDRAEEAYAKAMQLSPDAGVAWEYGSRLYCRTGRAAKAEQLVRAGLEKFPQSIELRTDLGLVLLHQGKFGPAAAEIKKVLRAEERNLRAMQLLAQVYLAEKKLELAKMVLDPQCPGNAAPGAEDAAGSTGGLQAGSGVETGLHRGPKQPRCASQ
jgi:Tfp pilus assembly protein PilF